MIHNVRPQFYFDLADEVSYLAEKAGPEIAGRWADAVWQTIEELEAFPEKGRERADLPLPGVRSWRVNHFSRWLIFYGVRENTLVLYRVRHGAMNLLAIDFNS